MSSALSTFEFESITVDAYGQECDRQRGSASCWIESLSEDVILEMVVIPGSTFLMGSPPDEEGWSRSQSPQHLTTVQPFLLGKYPVTQAQWQAIAQRPKVKHPLMPNPSSRQGADHPIEQVSWIDAMEFCARLTQYTGRQYRLPSEAEWEYACRAGTHTPFHFGTTLTTDIANYSGVDWEYDGKIRSRGAYGLGPIGQDRRETTPVGSFQVSNTFGLYDMHGNVREWCADPWHDSYQDAPTDGRSWELGGDEQKRIVRGGSWNVSPRACRSAFRSRFETDAGLYDIGFRVASG